jgi:NAD(P) transhydrogenase
METGIAPAEYACGTLVGATDKRGRALVQVEALTSDIVKLCGQSNLEVVMASRIPHLRGTASIVDPETTRVTFLDSARTVDVKGKATIIATGSRPYRLPGIPYDDKRVFDSDTIRNLSFLPRSVTIVGAGLPSPPPLRHTEH